MKNIRGAGRKPKIDKETMDVIKHRISTGEKISNLAHEYGISRQALYKRLKADDKECLVLDYVIDGSCATRIEIDVAHECFYFIDYALKMSDRAFGAASNPDWNALRELLQNEFFYTRELGTQRPVKEFICQDVFKDTFSLDDVLGMEKGHLQLISLSDSQQMPQFHFSSRNLLFQRTDTDGYQLKALSDDRRFFVKSQAIIGGNRMDDWAVELIASNFCRQLGISCIEQRECEFIYGNQSYKAVFSKNFELDGYTFVSFERLLERMGLSSNDEEFICLDAIGKMKWCAQKLAAAGDLSYEDTLQYMLNLALIDCLVANVDRHTKNFGLFFNSYTGKYEIPAIFDNGMGLFEHDCYKDSYGTFDDAMMNVYVAPYGEDPFDMLRMIDREFDLLARFPNLRKLEINSLWMTPFAKEYLERVFILWQKCD